MTTHHDVRDHALVKEHALLLSKAAAEVADSQIRHRGTFGGALAHADPAGDLGAPALALGAQFVIAGPGGSRTVEARGLLRRPLRDRHRRGRDPHRGAHPQAHRLGCPLREVRAGGTPVADRGHCRDRQGLDRRGASGADQHGLDPAAGERHGGGAGRASATEDGVREAAGLAAEGTHPPSDLNGAADYRQHLARVLTAPCRAQGRGGVAWSSATSSPSRSASRRPGRTSTTSRRWPSASPGPSSPRPTSPRSPGRSRSSWARSPCIYNGSGTFIEKDEAAHRFVVDAKGKDKRGNGTAGAKVVVTMSDAAGATDVKVDTDLAITGKPAQFGRGVMQDVSDKLLGQFVACLEQQLAGDPEPEAPRADPDRRRGGCRSSSCATAPTRAAAEAATAPVAGSARPGRGRAARAGEDLLEAGTGSRRGAGAPAPAAALTERPRRR